MTDDALAAVHNQTIEFATMRPPGSRSALLERRVVVTAPQAVADLASSGDPDIIEPLIAMLRDSERSWAAFVILAAVTRRNEKQADTYATSPQEWIGTVGPGAYDDWSRWYSGVRGKLVWDPGARAFTVR